MTKIVINTCWGGFSISLEAAKYMAERGHEQAKAEVDEYNERLNAIKYRLEHGEWPPNLKRETAEFLEVDAGVFEEYGLRDERDLWYGFGCIGKYSGYPRDDPLLVEAVEKLGPGKASGWHSKLKVVEIPDGTDWVIADYGGMERVCEKHREWM